MNRNKGDFSYNSRNIKITVDNVNENVTPSCAHKSNINKGKSVIDSNVESNYVRLQIPSIGIMKKNLY